MDGAVGAFVGQEGVDQLGKARVDENVRGLSVGGDEILVEGFVVEDGVCIYGWFDERFGESEEGEGVGGV